MTKRKKIAITTLTALSICCSACSQNTKSSDINSASTPNFQNETRFMPVRDESARIIQLSYQEVEAKMMKKESFILFIKQVGCMACQNFFPIIGKYVTDNKINIYSIEASDISSDGKLYFNYTPTLQIFKDGEMIDSQDPITASNRMFTNVTDLTTYLNDYIIINNQLFISDETLDSKIENKETFVVYFSWKTCGDCQMMNKMFLDEYLYNTRNKDYTLYVIEVDPWRSQKAENPDVWENFTSKYHLSKTSDEIFGYRTGVVPTIQYYVNGELNDAVVYFNDVLTTVNDEQGEIIGYKIDFNVEGGVFSYYPEEIKNQFENTVFTDYQAYKDETNAFYKQKLLNLFTKSFK